MAYHEEYRRIAEIVDQGGKGKQLKSQAEALAKDAIRSFQVAIKIVFIVITIPSHINTDDLKKLLGGLEAGKGGLENLTRSEVFPRKLKQVIKISLFQLI